MHTNNNSISLTNRLNNSPLIPLLLRLRTAETERLPRTFCRMQDIHSITTHNSRILPARPHNTV